MYLTLILIILVHSNNALPSLPKSWTARTLLQSDIASCGDTTTIVALKLPSDDSATPSLDDLIPTMIITKPTEQQAEQILKLMLVSLDRGDVKSIAMKLMPEYTKFCLTTLDCEELHSALRRLYLARYSELQLSLHRMDKLGLLLRRVQYLVEQSALDAASIKVPHANHKHHRRHNHPTLKRKPNSQMA